MRTKRFRPAAIGTLLCLLTSLAVAQDAVIQTDLIGLAIEAQRAVDAADWKRAATLTSALREATREARNRAWARATLDLEDRILAWLPADTETVAAWQEPFTLSAPDAARTSGSDTLRAYLLGLVTTAENGRFAKSLEGRTVRLSLLAARHFAPHPVQPGSPLPLGMIDFEGCAVYSFSEALPSPALARGADDVIGGQQVWTSRGSQHEAVRDGANERIFLASPEPDLLIACNNREFLSSMISRRDANRTPAPGYRGGFRPQMLALWPHVDRTSPFWAFRRFTPERAAVDPTQPANPSVLGKPDPEASALTVKMDNSGAFKALWISSSAADPWRTVLDAGAFERKGQSHMIAAGLWELSVPGDARLQSPAVLALMSCLGFAVLL